MVPTWFIMVPTWFLMLLTWFLTVLAWLLMVLTWSLMMWRAVANQTPGTLQFCTNFAAQFATDVTALRMRCGLLRN